jgi:hypothetical protein
MKTTNRDPGSLNVGNTPVVEGQLILIAGEDRPRKVTYKMGSVEKSNLHVVMKGTGPVPTGEIEWEIVEAVKEVRSTEQVKAEIKELQKLLNDEKELKTA